MTGWLLAEVRILFVRLLFGLCARAVWVWSGVEVEIGRHSESFHQATDRQKTSRHADMLRNTLPS